MGFLPCEIRVAFPGKSQLRQSRAIQPTVQAGCFSVSIIHRTLTWTTGSLSCAENLMHAIAHGGVRTPSRESALKVDSWKKNPLPHRGIEPASKACRSDALPTARASSPRLWHAAQFVERRMMLLGIFYSVSRRSYIRAKENKSNHKHKPYSLFTTHVVLYLKRVMGGGMKMNEPGRHK